MTHVPETGTENRYQKMVPVFQCKFYVLVASGIKISGTRNKHGRRYSCSCCRRYYSHGMLNRRSLYAVLATEYYDIKNNVIAYMAAVYAATDVMTDVIYLTASKEFRNASRIRTYRNLG